MKRIILLFCGFLVFNCTKQKEQGLNGAWQYVSGVYTFNDSTTTFTSDDVNSMKVYSDKYYSMNTKINLLRNIMLIVAHTPLLEMSILKYSK